MQIIHWFRKPTKVSDYDPLSAVIIRDDLQFMTEDMNMRSTDRTRREKAFHGEDEAITVDDLWEAWFESEERSWTNEQVKRL